MTEQKVVAGLTSPPGSDRQPRQHRLPENTETRDVSGVVSA